MHHPRQSEYTPISSLDLDQLQKDISWMSEDFVINAKWDRFSSRLAILINEYRQDRDAPLQQLFVEVAELTEIYCMDNCWKAYCKQLKKIGQKAGLKY